MKEKKYYHHLDLIRFFACVAIFLYHLNILPGGYLAVCSFLVLSAYLACLSAFKNKNFNIKKYYLGRLKKIYLPLAIVVFSTLAVYTLFPDLNWLNLKSETTSVLFGYNNFWQIGANLDYFARHLNSPFIHFWYIGILFQFELVFPFAFIFLRNLATKYKKKVPFVTLNVLSGISFIFLLIMFFTSDLMVTYYNTFTRITPLLLGMSLGFASHYYRWSMKKKIKRGKEGDIVFYLYFVLLALFFIFVGPKSSLMPLAMLLVSLITCRMIHYSIFEKKRKLSKSDQIIKDLSSYSYEIYLVQYPVIYFLQLLELPFILRIILTTIIVIITSFVIHFILNNRDYKWKSLRYVMVLMIGAISLCGAMTYVTAENYTKQMRDLKRQLEKNSKLVEERQKEYAKKLEEEEKSWNLTLDDFENSEKIISDKVINLPIVGIGDSIMLGAVPNLNDRFVNGYFDAKVSRTAFVVHDMIEDLKSKNMLGDIVIFNLGANGDCSESRKDEIMESIGSERQVFWITVTNDKDVHFNDKIKKYAEKYDNLHIIDWEKASKGKKNYFAADGIHLTGSGRKAYTETIYQALFDYYAAEFEQEKERIIAEHEEAMNKRVTFYGNEMLLKMYNYLHENFSDGNFINDDNLDLSNLNTTLADAKEKGTLTKNIVIALDKNIKPDNEEFQNILNSYPDYNFYLVTLKETITPLNSNLTTIDFSKELKDHKEYLLKDKVNLSKDGLQALSKKISIVLQEKTLVVEN